MSLYISMDNKSLNSKSKNSDNINVDLDFDDDPNEDRTWVNKDRFGEFESEYQDLQDNNAVSTAVQIEFEMRITVRNVDKQNRDEQPMATADNSLWGHARRKTVY